MPTSKGLIQAYQLQDFAHATLMAYKAQLTKDNQLTQVTKDDAQAIGTLMTAWKTAQERVSFHRRVPSPGSLTHKAPLVRRARAGSASAGPVSIAPNNDVVDVSDVVAPDTTPAQDDSAATA